MFSTAILSRRRFISGMALALGGLAAPGAAQAASGNRQLLCFIKPFQNSEPARIAEIVREVGWDGVEIPVRKGGTVEPAEVEDALPRLVEELRKRGVALSLIATDVDDAGDPLAQKVLRIARQLGIKQYRTKHCRYDLKKPIAPQVDRYRNMMHDLAALNREIGIQGGVQNHSGATYVGAPVWDIWEMLRDIDPQYLGIYFDIAHATIEGGLSWPLEARLSQPHLVTVSVKDFLWQRKKGGQGWSAEWCPLGEGMVDANFFARLKKTEYAGPISMHFEYELGKDQQMIASFKKDLATLRRWLA